MSEKNKLSGEKTNIQNEIQINSQENGSNLFKNLVDQVENS